MIKYIKLIYYIFLLIIISTNSFSNEQNIESNDSYLINNKLTQKTKKEFNIKINNLIFLPDNQHYLISSLFDGIYVVNLSGKYLLKKASDEEIINSGFIDKDHIYYNTSSQVYVYQLSNNYPIFTYPSVNRPAYVNGDFLLIADSLVNWKQGKNWQVRHAGPRQNHYQLFDNGSVLSYESPDGIIALHNPITGEYREKRVAKYATFKVTPDGQYVILANEDGRCEIWQASDFSLLGKCKSPKLSKSPYTDLSIDQYKSQFALINKNQVTVYQLPEVKPIFTAKSQNTISAVDLNSNLIVIGDEKGGIAVWDIDKNNKISQSTFIVDENKTNQPMPPFRDIIFNVAISGDKKHILISSCSTVGLFSLMEHIE